jgi:hypothetical protein
MMNDSLPYHPLSSVEEEQNKISDELKRINNQKSHSGKYLVMTLLAIPLGVPDGVTYSHFGFQAGASLAGYLSVQNSRTVDFFSYLVGIGAPTGVYFFAVNNLMRELLFLVSPAENRMLLSQPSLRKNARRITFILASLSMIPFAGMAMNAANGYSTVPYYLLVISNSFARFCMNDYALRCLFEKLLANFLIYFDYQGPVRNHLLQRLEKNCYNYFHNNLDISIGDQKSTLDRYFSTPENDISEEYLVPVTSSSTKKWKIALDAYGYFVGAVTATYLYSFAIDASKEVTQVDNHSLNSALAILGVIPTLALWADDSMFGIRVMVISLYNAIYSYKDQDILSGLYKRAISLDKLRLGVKTLSVVFAGLGAFSESKMAYDVVSGDNGFYANLLRVCVIPAFAGIYITSALQLSDKLINKFGIHFIDSEKAKKAKNIEEFDNASQLVEKLGKTEIAALQVTYGGKNAKRETDSGEGPRRTNCCTRIMDFFFSSNRESRQTHFVSETDSSITLV